MYKILELKDRVKVHPKKLSLELEEGVKVSLREQYEGKISSELGVVLNLEEVEEIGEGRIYPRNGSVHYPVKFKILTWWPLKHEVVLGEVIDITNFGAFLRIGPLDGMVHISQVMDDYVSYDEKNRQLAGRESKRNLRIGDAAKARIISVSWEEEHKIGLTMRQPGLGALKWFEKEKAK